MSFAVEWFRMMATDQVLLKCENGHTWKEDGLKFHALAEHGSRPQYRLQHFPCPTCADLFRASIVLKFEDPDYLRVEGSAE